MVRSRSGTLWFSVDNSSVLTVNSVSIMSWDVDQLSVLTDSLGFFLGPGRALTFTGSSTPAPSSLFVPVFGLEGSFSAASSADGGAVFEIVGAGVSFESVLDSSWAGGSEAVASVEVDKGDFFLGTDFGGAGS